MKNIPAILIGIVTVAPAADVRSAEDWNPTVLKLLTLDERDAALETLYEQNRVPEESRQPSHSIKEVVICPQPHAASLLAVFLRTSARGLHQGSPKWPDPLSGPGRNGPFILVRSNGRFVEFYRRENVVLGHFADLNVDGVIDYIGAQNSVSNGHRFIRLNIVPVLEDFSPSLKVLWISEGMRWRVIQPNTDWSAKIQIGFSDAPELFQQSRNEFEVVAEFVWNNQVKEWHGPVGSKRDGFVVSRDSEEDSLSELLGAASR